MKLFFIVLGIVISIAVFLPINTYIFKNENLRKHKRKVYSIKLVLLAILFVLKYQQVLRYFDEMGNPFWGILLYGFYLGLFFLLDLEDIKKCISFFKKITNKKNETS
ncbi:MAG: hypothetical protein JEY91_15905 [Spirochaetaceae bacterium]|nr:hypothetical protein [Spirochaetaceae bacterium]